MMFQLQSFVSALTLSAVVANAASIPRSRASFTLQQVPVLKSARNAFDHYSAALAKHKGRIPSGLLASATQETQVSPSPSDEGTAMATPIGMDKSYLIPVTVGDSTLHMDLDTGSSDLWVYSDKTPENQRTGHDLYKPSKNGKQIDDSSWTISYNDGSGASGIVYQDRVAIGDVSYDKQGVEVATQVSQKFVQDQQNDGLIGMAFSSLNNANPKQKTFFDNVLDDLDEPLFTASLKHDEPGSYDFGFIDKSKYTGDIFYTDVDSSRGFWTITVDSYSAGNASGSSFDGVVDTGTTLLLLDDDIVSNYYTQVQGAGIYDATNMFMFDCNTKLPDFTFKIGDHTATVPGDRLIWTQEWDLCVGGLQSNNGGDNILGDIFLKSQFVVFENKGDQPRVGFAPQA